MFVPAWMLVLVALLVGWLLAQRRQAERFSPYRVTIRPEWRALLDDHLDMTPKRWKAIKEWGGAHPDEPASAWRDGLSFTVLTSTERGRLTYILNTHVFQSTLDWIEPVPGLHWPPSDLDREFRSEGPQPRFLVVEDTDAYELVIEVRETDMLHPARRGEAQPHHYAVDAATLRLSVARLPLAVFDSRGHERTIHALAQRGWSAPIVNPDVFAAPIEIKHQYAHVSFSYI